MGANCKVHGDPNRCVLHWIYVAGVAGGPFKIGMTRDVSRRMALLRQGRPGLSCLHRVEVRCEYLALSRERRALNKLDPWRVGAGDWFDCDFENARDTVNWACGK